MKTKRNKPRLAVTVDADVRAWIAAESKRRRVSLSDVVNGIMADAMAVPEGEKRRPSPEGMSASLSSGRARCTGEKAARGLATGHAGRRA